MSDSNPYVTRTKIVVPRRRSQLLTRRRLFDQFGKMLSFKCISISAPAGYGKTSLLIDTVHQLNLPVCWYALDPLDNDPYRFYAHFLAALAQTFPHFQTNRPSLALSQNRSLLQVVTPLVNAIHDQIQQQFLFVLEDLHQITNPDIISFVDQFLLLVDDHCRLAITSRELINLPSVLLLAGRADLGGIGTADLAFSAADIQALVQQNHHTSLTDSAAAELIHSTGGWITGLLLSTHSVWQNVVNRMQLAGNSGVSVYDYLTGQVFNQQPAPVQDFLLKTSLLGAFNADWCQTVLGPPNYPAGESWPALMQTVMRNNLFVVQLNTEGLWLRYHHLFEEFLQNKIHTESPSLADDILRKLAQAYVAQGQWEKAYNAHQRLGTTATAAPLVEQAGIALIAAGRFQLLANWIDNLSAQTLNNRPLLLAQRGYAAAMLGDVSHGKFLLDRAIAAMEQAGGATQLANSLVWRAGVNRLLGNPPQALADVEHSLRLTRGIPDLMELTAMALRAKGQLLHSDRAVNESISAYEQALDIYRSLGNSEETARVYLETGISYMAVGRYEEARRFYALAEQHFLATQNQVRLADLYNNWGVLHLLTGQSLTAIATLEKALSLARQSGYTRLEAYALCGIGDVFADAAAPDAADTAYSMALQLATQADDHFLRLYLELAKTRQARLKKDYTLAANLLDSAARLASEANGSYVAGLLAHETGQLALAREQFDVAVGQLQQALAHLHGDGLRLERAKSHLSLAAAHYHAKRQPDAFKAVITALDDAAPLENIHPLAVAALPHLPLLRQARTHPALAANPQFNRLMGHIQTFTESLPALHREIRRQCVAVEFVAPRLTIRTLGPIEVLQNEAPVSNVDWLNQRRAREVFFFLLAHPESFTREAIGLEIWPKSGPTELKRQFKNTIYRLRRALGRDIIDYDKDLERYSFNRELDYEYDVELFERHLAEAETATLTAAKLDLLNAAIQLYRGPYLPELEQTWVLPKRQYLSHLYVQANLQVAHLHLEAEHPNAALPFCWNILQEDSCHEPTHRLIMTIHAKNGNRAAVVRQFEQCRKALHDEIGAPVSPKTLALYRQLIS
ncbi:MAG: BTAD domain-containing putative transcriptional regulator [Anaerolineae bacterium]